MRVENAAGWSRVGREITGRSLGRSRGRRQRTIVYAMRVKRRCRSTTNVDNVVVIRHPDDGDDSNKHRRRAP